MSPDVLHGIQLKYEEKLNTSNSSTYGKLLQYSDTYVKWAQGFGRNKHNYVVTKLNIGFAALDH